MHPRAKNHNAIVTQKINTESGVAARAATQNIKLLASIRLANNAVARSKNERVIPHVATTVPTASNAEKNRPANSLTPKMEYAIPINQYSNAGFCCLSSSLNIGTIQSPRAIISAAQPAFRGSSRSQYAASPSAQKKTNPETNTISGIANRGRATGKLVREFWSMAEFSKIASPSPRSTCSQALPIRRRSGRIPQRFNERPEQNTS